MDIGEGAPNILSQLAQLFGGGAQKAAPGGDTFEQWKAKYAPHDSGADYDLLGAYKAGLKPDENHHFPDTFKKPNHPTFSVESQYWQPGMAAGRWGGAKNDQYIKMSPEEAVDWVRKHPEVRSRVKP